MKLPLASVLLLLGCLLGPALASAEAPSDVDEARRLYKQGIEQVRAAEWARALDSFERSAALRPHAVTSYNIGACHRAMGRYTRARAKFREALQRAGRHSDELPANLARDSARYLDEMDRLLAHVRVRIRPADTLITVDGAPLRVDPVGEGGPIVVAGLAPTGKGRAAPAARFELLLDPGAHVFLLSRRGFRNVAIPRQYAPGERAELLLELDRLPATLHISADREDAAVRVNGQPLGLAPIDLTRPAGSHRVEIAKEGFETYESQVRLTPGQELALRARLTEKQPSVLSRWWFWTAAGAVVAGAVVVTYVLTRPEPTRPPLDGGGLGWTVPLE